MLFPKHGKVAVDVEGTTVLVRAEGTFNEEGALHYCQAIRHAVNPLLGEPFTLLIDLTKLEGATPESWQVAENRNQWLLGTSMRAKAIVADTSVVRNYASKVNQQGLNDNIRLFDNHAEAKAWLSEVMSLHSL